MNLTNVISIDFRRRVKAEAIDIETVSAASLGIFERYDYQIKCIQKRFGENQSYGGVVYKATPLAEGFDTYGRGNVHDSLHQWQPLTPAEKLSFNRPLPFPADLRAIDKLLERSEGTAIRLGVKSDPFMWMDKKYCITKSVIELATKHGVTLVIHTMSDLPAETDYINLLIEDGHKIVMHMGFKQMRFMDDASLERYISPGAPSRSRRERAIGKLIERGVNVCTKYTDLSKMIKNNKMFFELCRRPGKGPVLLDRWSFP